MLGWRSSVSLSQSSQRSSQLLCGVPFLRYIMCPRFSVHCDSFSNIRFSQLFTRRQRFPAVRRAAQVHRGQSRPGHIAHVQNRRQARNVLLAERQQGNSGKTVEAPARLQTFRWQSSGRMRILFATCKPTICTVPCTQTSVTQFRKPHKSKCRATNRRRPGHINHRVLISSSAGSPPKLTMSARIHISRIFTIPLYSSSSSLWTQPVGIYPKKYEWAASVVGMHMLGIQSPNIGGDCSLWVRSATIEFDNGHWECQVTSSDFTTQDALTSQPVRLVVRSKWKTLNFNT